MANETETEAEAADEVPFYEVKEVSGEKGSNNGS
jgi:hypothetical protein